MERTEALVGGATTRGVIRQGDRPEFGAVGLQPANLGKLGRVGGNIPNEDHAATRPSHRTHVAATLWPQNRYPDGVHRSGNHWSGPHADGRRLPSYRALEPSGSTEIVELV